MPVPTSRRALLAAGGTALAVVLVPLALAVRAAYGPLLDADAAVTDAAEGAVTGSAALLGAARAVTLLGDPALTWVATAAVAAVLARRGSPRLAVFLLAVRAGTQLLTSLTKVLVDRARPAFDLPVDTASGASFPSGHTLAAAGLWAALAVLLLPAVRPPRRALLLVGGVAVAAAVGASRVLLGVHYLSDVVGGLLLGLGWTALCTAVLVGARAADGVPVPTVSDAVSDERERPT